MRVLGHTTDCLVPPSLRCRMHCSGRGKTYYGMVQGEHCSCGVNPPTNNVQNYLRPESYCDRVCPADHQAMCGGGTGGGDNRVNIYRV